jgi:pimeloyl-ACP methyl ester carboxylesterase
MNTSSPTTVEWIDLHWQGRKVSIEHQWLNSHWEEQPLFIFLHEGLGSVSMWRDYPQHFCDALQVRGLVYSRPGYGQSTPRATNEVWGNDFMHQQAHELLPHLLSALGVRQAPWLLGHSDGGSIALLYAAKHPTAGLMVMAPHIKVEDICIQSIEQAKVAYENTNLREKLSKYHADVDSAFWGWNQIWLHPDFRNWNIEKELSTITCPLLAIQGLNDEYGTLSQIRDIQKYVSQTQLFEIENCAHSPHRDQPEALTKRCLSFFKLHSSQSN